MVEVRGQNHLLYAFDGFFADAAVPQIRLGELAGAHFQLIRLFVRLASVGPSRERQRRGATLRNGLAASPPCSRESRAAITTSVVCCTLWKVPLSIVSSAAALNARAALPNEVSGPKSSFFRKRGRTSLGLPPFFAKAQGFFRHDVQHGTLLQSAQAYRRRIVDLSQGAYGIAHANFAAMAQI